MGKIPYFPFYPGDWRRDTQVQMASMSTRGVWFEMLCCMFDAPERGKLMGSYTEIARLLGCPTGVLKRAVTEIKRYKIGDVTECNDSVTIINRRMYREQKVRNDTRLRVQRHREVKARNAQGNESETAPISYSYSDSYSDSNKEKNKDKVIIVPNDKKDDRSGLDVAFISIPLKGKGKKEFEVTEGVVTELQELFPSVDVRQKLREIKAWNISNPSRQKTSRGIMTHITCWLSREQDRGGGRGGRRDQGDDNSIDRWLQKRRLAEQKAREGQDVPDFGEGV